MAVKKIIVCVTNDLSYDQRMQKTCNTLASAGYEVTMVGRILPDSKNFCPENYGADRFQCYFNKGKFFYLEYNFRLFFWLIKRDFDVVCAVDLDTLLAAHYAAKWKRAKVICDAHEYFTEVPEVIHRPFVQSVWKWVEQRYLPKAAHVYTVSKSIADEFYYQYGIRATVIRNMPFLNQTKISSGVLTFVMPKEPIILYQGALNEGRGLEQMIEAMRGLDFHLVLAGEGDITEDLKEKVIDMEVQDKVTFVGKLTPEELHSLTDYAWIGINLLEKRGLNYYYSLANKFFDYIHAAKPQVCMNFPEYERINNQYLIAELVEDTDPKTIKEAVNNIRRNDKLYAYYVENCKKARLDLNWENESKVLLKMYENLLN